MSDDEHEHVVETRSDLARWIRSQRREATAKRFYVRFGPWKGERSRRGLDAEFLTTLEGGLHDAHRDELGGPARYERGISVYFAVPAPDGTGWHMLEPSRRRALYQLRGDYLVDMCSRIFFDAICAGDVFLVNGRPVSQRFAHTAYVEDENEYVNVTAIDYETGADGEPLAQDLTEASRFDLWGDAPGLPKLYVGGPHDGRRIDLVQYLTRYSGPFRRRFTASRLETCAMLEEESDDE